MQGNEIESRRDVEPAHVDPRLAQQNEAVRQMQAAGFMAAEDAVDPAPPVAAVTGLGQR